MESSLTQLTPLLHLTTKPLPPIAVIMVLDSLLLETLLEIVLGHMLVLENGVERLLFVKVYLALHLLHACVQKVYQKKTSTHWGI